MESQNIEQQQLRVRFYHPKLIDKTITVSPTDALNELRQPLAENSLLYFFQNYNFEQKEKKLSQVHPIVSIVNPEEQIDIVLQCFDERTARYHFSKVADITSNPDLYAYILRQQTESKGANQDIPIAQQLFGDFNLEFKKVIDYNFSNILFEKDPKPNNVQLVSYISLSGFNPPPSVRRMSGDLFYIQVKTLESSDYHITATPQGFYVNQSKINNFNPQISNTFKSIYVNLIDLLRNISQKFRENLKSHVEQRRMTQVQIYKLNALDRSSQYQWLETCDYQHSWNSRKFQKGDFKLEVFGIKDWNELFQYNRDMPNIQKNQQFQKFRSFNKLYKQFQIAAIEGAKALIDGKIPPLNPMDDSKKHIYIYDNIFFSIANETPFNHSQQKGEDATPSSSAVNTDIINLEILENLNIPNLHVLHMVIINYRGSKVIAQCIIPGILTGDQANCSQYGSIDDGKTIQTNPQFEKIMIQVCNKLHLKQQIYVRDGNGVQKKIAGSPDIKGILGSDKRKYILDLLRLSPRDLNYPGIQNQVCVIRPQLIHAFKQFKKQQNIQIPRINTNIATQITFKQTQTYQEELSLIQEITNFIKDKAIPNLINSLKTNLASCLTDSKGASTAFHLYGVNLRYLGYICKHDLLKDSQDIVLCLERVIVAKSLKHLFRIAMRQTNILYLNQTLTHLLNSIFSRRINLQQLQQGQVNMENTNIQTKQVKKKKNKKKNQQKQLDKQTDNNTYFPTIKVLPSQYLSMKPSQLWSIVQKIAKLRYDYQLANIFQFQIFKKPYQKLATLRDLCLMIGLIIEKKNYNIIQNQVEPQKILPFSIKNIVELRAIPKKRSLKFQKIDKCIKQADILADKYQIKQALTYYNNANTDVLYLTGGLVEELAHIRSKMGKVFYVMGNYQQAILNELTALHIRQAISSQDQAKTIQSYSTLGLYYSVKGEKADKIKAFYYLYKSIFLMLISFGQTHPDFLINISNLSRIHHQNLQYGKSIEIYLSAIQILMAIKGKNNLKISFCYSSLATLHYQTGDLRKAIQYQTQSVGILVNILPQNDPRLNDAKKILKVYRQVSQSGKNYQISKPIYQGNQLKQQKNQNKGQIKNKNKNNSKR